MRKYFSYRRDKLRHDLPGLDHGPVEGAEEVVPLDVLLGPGAQPLTRVPEQQRGDQPLAVPADRPGVPAQDLRCYYYCLRSRPIYLNVVCQSVTPSLSNRAKALELKR